MGFDFWLQSNNGKKYSLKDFKDLKPDYIAKNPKLQKFIKLFDFDNSGTIEVQNKNGQNEWQSIFTDLLRTAVDNNLTSEEFGLYISEKFTGEDLKIEDVNELLEAGVQESEEDPLLYEFLDTLFKELQEQQKLDNDKEEVYNNIFRSEIHQIKLKKDYNSVEELALSILKLNGKQNLTEDEQKKLNKKILELSILNKDISLKSGAKINVKGNELPQTLIVKMESLGFSPNPENISLLNYINQFDKNSQSEIINFIKNKNCKTAEEAFNAIEKWQKNTQAKYDKALKNIYCSQIKDITLKNSYKTARELALKLLKFDTKSSLTKEELQKVDDKVLELELLNNDCKFTAGTKISIKGKKYTDEFITKVTSYGFPPSSENMGILNFLSELDNEMQKDALELLKFHKVKDANTAGKVLQKWQEKTISDQERQIREASIQCLVAQGKNAIMLIDQFTENLSVLDSEWWDENFGSLLETVFGDSDDWAITLKHHKEIIKRNITQAKKDLTALLDNPPAFQQKFKQLTGGVKYDQEKIMAYINAINSGKDGKNEYETAFGKEGIELVNFVEQQVSKKTKFNTAGNIASMLIGTRAIGQVIATGWQKIATLTNMGRKIATLSETTGITGKITRTTLGTIMGSTNFAAWEGFKAASTVGTKALSGTEITERDLKTLYEAPVGGAVFGAFAHLSNVFLVSKAEGFVLKLFEKGEYNGAEFMEKMLGNTPEFSEALKGSKDGLASYLKQQFPQAAAGVVGFGTEALSFSAYEITAELLSTENTKKALIEAGEKPENVENLSRMDIIKHSLLQGGIEQSELEGLDDTDLIEAYLGQKLVEQGKTLLSFKGVGKLLQWRMGGRIVQLHERAEAEKIISASKILKKIKIKPVTEKGKKFFEISLPDGKKERVSSIQDALNICQRLAYFEAYVQNAKSGEINVESQIEYENIKKIVESEASDLSVKNKPQKTENTNVTKQTLDAKINELPDGEIKDYINKLKEDASEFMSFLVYPRLNKLIDAYKNVLNTVECVKDENIKQNAMNMIRQSVLSDDFTGATEKLSYIDEYIKIQTMSQSERFMSYLKNIHPKIYEEVQKNPDEINNPKYKEIKNDFLKLQKYENIITECRAKSGTSEADAVYEKYLNEEIISGNTETDTRIKDLCRQINKDFGVKVFLPSNLKEAGVGLKLVYQQLARYQMHAKAHGETANMPATLDFYRSEINFVKSSNVAGKYKQKTNSMSLNGLTIDIIKKALAHELTHANDEQQLKDFPKDFDPRKYRQEFASAGIIFEQFMYACKNPKEFIAVASEGNISRYSESFKNILKEFGMPEWMFEMDRVLTPEEQEKLDGNTRLFNDVFKDIEDYEDTEEDLMRSVVINDADKEAIGRYKELVAKRNAEGLSQTEMNELLGLTMNLNDKGYRFGANRELDFDYNPNIEIIPNLNMTKAELRNKLSAIGLSDSAIESIEYNSNKIAPELLNAIDDPELLEKFRASVLIAYNKDVIPNKLEIYKLLKSSSIPTEVKAKILGETYEWNFTDMHLLINYTNNMIAFLKEHNVEEGLISQYANILSNRATFSRELFEQISKYNKELLYSDICFDVNPTDIPAKMETYNLIKERNLPKEDILKILRTANEENIENIRIIESQRNNLSDQEINSLYRHIDMFNENTLNALKTNILLLEYYDVVSLSHLTPEDLEAKNNILAELKAFKFDKSLFVKKATKENYEKIRKQVKNLNNIANLEGLAEPYKREIAGLAISGNYNTDVMDILINAVKDDADLLTRNLLESKSEFTKDIFRTKTVEEAKQKAEIYNLVKEIQDSQTKLYYMNLVSGNNFEALKTEIVKDLPTILKFETARNIRIPQFTETEKQEMNNKIEEIKNILAQKAPEKTDEYLRMFNKSNTIEAFNAKYNVFKRLTAEDKLDNYWLLHDVVIQEQADIINNIGINYHTDGICDKNFAQKYPFLKYFDKNMKAQGIASHHSGDDFVRMVAQIETPEQFQRFKILWTDTNLSKLSNDCILNLAKDLNKFNLYKQFCKLERNKTEDEVLEIVKGLASGNITEVSNVEQMLKQTALAESKDILAGYRAGNERHFNNAQSKEEIYNRLKVTFPNLNIKNIENVSDEDTNFLEEYISNYQELTFEQIENAVNNGDVAGLSIRANIIVKFPTDTAFYLAFCEQTKFDEIVSILEKRPEIMIKPYDKDTFVKLVNMSDTKWEALKVPVTERTNPNFNPQQYSREVQELLNSGFTLNLDTWNGIERHRMLQAQNHLGRPTGNGVVRFDNTPLVHANRPVLDLPTPDALIKQLETTGSFTLEIGNVKGLPPIQVKNDKAIVKPNEPTGVQETDQSINIGETRIWDNHRLARDLLQNFYDGNGHTMEGVTISVEKRGNKYAVKIGGRGIFDYDRVLDFGGGSKGGQSKEYVYGIQSGDPESAGHHGEGSKVIAGNLLCTRGSGYVRYASGDWILTLGIGDDIIIGDNVEKVITKEVTKASERLEGTTYEFETDDIDLVKSILEAKDYFNGPSNVDWATPDIENEYFAIKFLPKGEKGNLYVVQRFEVEGQEGFDGTLDGITLIFKRQPNDEGLKNDYFENPYKLEVGRNRVGLTRDDITKMVHRYAMTLDNESLTKILGNMEESFLYNSDSPNRDIAEAFMWAAFYKGIKIDFGHDKYIATLNDMNARYIESYGKIPVNSLMKFLGVPTDAEFEKANENAMMPKMDLTEIQTKKLKLLSEAMRMFSSHLDLENCDVISDGNVKKPVYVTEAIVQADENATGEVRAESITDCNGYYGGHWVKESYLNEGDFFDLLATWLHETSHKVDGDGTTPFNERLMKLQELIVNISNTDHSFGQQLRILSNEFDKLSGKNVADVTVTQSNLNEIEGHISQLLRTAVEQASTITAENVDVTTNPQPATSTNIFKRLYQKFYNKLWGTTNQKLDPYIRAEIPSFGVKKTPKSAKVAQQQRVKDPMLTTYESPAPVVPSQITLNAATPERNLQILEQKGSVSIQIPIRGDFNPKISDSSILPNDRKNLGITQNSSLTLDYNNAQEWTREIIARDLFQNFYDGHNGTLDGVNVEIQEVNGKYKIKISGQSEYNYFYLKTIGASDKTDDPRKAGGFGEGAKMASKTLLGEGLVDKITFASGDWTMDFTREEGIPRENNPHLARTLYENSDRVNGTFVEFETNDKQLVEAILRGKDYFESSENADFNKIRENGIENDDFGFVVLPEDEKGNLYYIQRYAIKKDGQLEGALKGLSIIFKRQLSYEEKQRFDLADDPDRKGFTALDIQKVTEAMVKTMTKEQLITSVEQLERFWSLETVDDINAAMKGKLELTPEQTFAKSMAREAKNRYVRFDSEDLKMVAIAKDDNGYDVQRLQKMGYKIVFDYMKGLGIPSVKEVISKLDNVSDIQLTNIEKQKIALLKDAFESGLKVEINLFDAEPNENKVRGIVNDWGEIQYIAIDRKVLSETDFNTLYSQILIQYNFSKKAETWGYNMTHMIAKQLNLSKDPLYMERFNALAKTFNELK